MNRECCADCEAGVSLSVLAYNDGFDRGYNHGADGELRMHTTDNESAYVIGYEDGYAAGKHDRENPDVPDEDEQTEDEESWGAPI